MSSCAYGGAHMQRIRTPVRARDELVPRAGRDQHCVALPHVADDAVDLEDAAALGDEVDLLGPRVVVALRRLPGLEARLGERLRTRVVKLADGRSVLGRERLGVCQRPELHGAILRVCPAHNGLLDALEPRDELVA